MNDANNPFWKQFEQFFGSAFPVPKNMPLNDLSWIEPYVQNTLHQILSATTTGKPQVSADAPSSETFETVNHVIVKVRIPEKTRARNTKVYAGMQSVRIEEGIGVRKDIIPLPVPVIPESCKAVYKNGVLQLRLKKQQTDDRFYEVKVRFLNE